MTVQGRCTDEEFISANGSKPETKYATLDQGTTEHAIKDKVRSVKLVESKVSVTSKKAKPEYLKNI